jgi:hypothetical protein
LGLKENTEIEITPVIAGIGRISGYTNTDSFHTTHGRPIALAAGVKSARPDLKPVVISGDGDLFAIGGNHFIHAARRNTDILVIMGNNMVYGMTGEHNVLFTIFASSLDELQSLLSSTISAIPNISSLRTTLWREWSRTNQTLQFVRGNSLSSLVILVARRYTVTQSPFL